jgi:hypothetical protein
MTEQTNKTPLEQARAFAAAELGDGSMLVLEEPATVERFQARVEHGFRVQDAVLAEIHRASRSDRQVANEFVSYFLQDMLRVGSGALRDGLRLRRCSRILLRAIPQIQVCSVERPS